jgi:hypothetical protein
MISMDLSVDNNQFHELSENSTHYGKQLISLLNGLFLGNFIFVEIVKECINWGFI